MLDASFSESGVYLPATGTLVVADVHAGRAAASDVEFPLNERQTLVERLQRLLATFSPAEVVFAGDVLHAFDRVPAGARETVTALAEASTAAGTDPVFVAGNHDAMLGSVVDDVHESYRVGDVLVSHGHVAPDEAAGLYVVGHDHPTITIEGRKRPCYLYGPDTYRGSDVLMLPAFTPLASGVVVNTMRASGFQSPLIADADALRPIVRDDDADETYTFPPLGEFRTML